jgi:signal transduction histidine kinase
MTRAFAVFGGALILLSAIAGQLAFREVSVSVLAKRLDIAQHEATEIAQAVTALAGEGGGINFARLRKRQNELRNMVHECFSRRWFIHHVAVHDRFGVRQFITFSESIVRPVRPLDSREAPGDWPIGGEQIVRAALQGAEGEVRVALAAAPVLEELTQLKRSLQIKVAVAGSLALIVLVGGFLYVLHLIRKNRTLEQSRESAARASYVGLLASGLAHEIRNPLNSMNMNLQMLEEELAGMPDQDRSDWSELLDSTKSEIKRLERLVNNFLAYARPARPHFEPRDLNEVATELLRFLEADFRQSEVELETDFEPLLPSVELDETQFKQALINLLVNARQVLQGGGSITVRTRPGQGGEVVLEVEDDGPGIPLEARERIFEVFYSSRGGGTGLGLPIARQIVERHGGTIEIESEESKGTVFRIRLPRQQRRGRDTPGMRPHPA